jgi:hypothetical protein
MIIARHREYRDRWNTPRYYYFKKDLIDKRLFKFITKRHQRTIFYLKGKQYLSNRPPPTCISVDIPTFVSKAAAFASPYLRDCTCQYSYLLWDSDPASGIGAEWAMESFCRACISSCLADRIVGGRPLCELGWFRGSEVWHLWWLWDDSKALSDRRIVHLPWKRRHQESLISRPVRKA